MLFLLPVVLVLAWLHRGDASGLLHVLRAAPEGLGVAALVHAPQLALTGLAWAVLIPRATRPGLVLMSLVRWVREAATALLPAGGLIGQAMAARTLIRRGIDADLAAATATVDLTIEASTQLLFTLGGLCGLLALQGATDLGRAVGVSLAIGVVGITLLVAAQRGLPLGSASLQRLGRRLPSRARRFLVGLVAQVRRVRHDVARLHTRPGRLLLAALLHLAAWALGAGEIWGVLHLLGQRPDALDCLVIESVAQALRSAGFLLPGGVGVQEGAIVAACALVGVSAEPALAMALVRRAREVAFGVTGLAMHRRVDAWATASAQHAEANHMSAGA